MSEVSQAYRKNMTDTMNDILLSTANTDEDDFKSYKDTALDWSWDNITGG